jgi:hypothetical protein
MAVHASFGLWVMPYWGVFRGYMAIWHRVEKGEKGHIWDIALFANMAIMTNMVILGYSVIITIWRSPKPLLRPLNPHGCTCLIWSMGHAILGLYMAVHAHMGKVLTGLKGVSNGIIRIWPYSGNHHLGAYRGYPDYWHIRIIGIMVILGYRGLEVPRPLLRPLNPP